MNPKLTQIWHSPSVRNVGKLLSANVIAQALGILVYPLLTRLYSPEDFGLLNLFSSIAGVLILLATMEWYNAIVLPKNEDESRALVHVSLLCSLVLTIILVATIPFASSIAGVFNTPELARYYWLLPIYVLLCSMWNTLNYWYIQRKAYDRISGYQVSQSLLSAGYKTGFGFIPLSGGLIYATILSPLCSLVISLGLAWKKHLRQLLHWDWSKCKQVAKEYSNFPKYSTPRVILNNIIGQLPVLVLTPIFGSRDVGFWGMALMLSFVPISIVSRAIYQVFFQKTTELIHARQSIWFYYRHFTLGTVAIVIPSFVVLGVFLPQLTAWLLGEEWRTVGEYIRWMLPWLTTAIGVLSTGFIPDVFAKQKGELVFEILMALARVIGVLIGLWKHDFILAVAGFSIGSAIVSCARYIWQLKLIKLYEKSL